MTKSLKRQLLVWLLVPLLVILPIAAVVEYRLVLVPAKQEIDLQLGDYAIAIASFIKVDGEKIQFAMNPETEHLLRTDQLDTEFFLVLSPDGMTIGGDATLNTPEDMVGIGESRYLDRKINGRRMRMLIYGAKCGQGACQVRIAETLMKRDKVQYQALIATLISIVVLGLVTAGVILIAVRHALRPLLDLQTQLADRYLDDLRPLRTNGIPSEVMPLLSTLNQLFARLKEAIAAQKTFIADAAHQLRTPLTALQTESELALLEQHPDSIHPTLERLHQSASRSVKLANQLLTIARADPSVQTDADFAPVDLTDIGAWAANEWAHRAILAGADLGFELQPAIVHGHSVFLQELLSNLIHNSIEHGGPGVRITVRTHLLENMPTLEVEDDGPGIAAEEHDHALQRFFRGRDARGNGSGLGLAIVKEIAHIHGARIELITPGCGKGLLVRVIFPSTDKLLRGLQ